MKEGTKVYFVDLRGDLLEYTVIKKDGFSPCSGCDILIERSGFISSANSQSYFTDKREALKQAELMHRNWLASAEEDAEQEKAIIFKISNQLRGLI